MDWSPQYCIAVGIQPVEKAVERQWLNLVADGAPLPIHQNYNHLPQGPHPSHSVSVDQMSCEPDGTVTVYPGHSNAKNGCRLFGLGVNGNAGYCGRFRDWSGSHIREAGGEANRVISSF